MHTLYVTNLTFVVLLAHQEYLYSNHNWNKSLITQWLLYITNECVNKDKKVELYVVEKGKKTNSLSKIRRVYSLPTLRKKSFGEGPLIDYGPALDPPPGSTPCGLGPKSIQMFGVMSTLSLPSLVNIHLGIL